MNFNLDFFIHDPWKDFLNKNIKWSLAVIIRFVVLVGLLTLCFLTMKKLDLLPSGNSNDGTLVVEAGNTINVSKPGISNYQPTVKDLETLITKLKNKKEEMVKNEKDKK